MADRAPRILLVDDEPPIQTLLSFPLERDGYEVVAAHNGIEALALAEQHEPTVAVLDVGMPGLDGIEVLTAIRAAESLAHTRVLLLTAKAQESDVRRGYDAGADAYVKKPFSPAELATRVRELYEAAGAL